MNTAPHRYQIIPIFVWLGLSLFVMILSYKLGLGGLHNPGPGLMPFVLGCLLCITSFYLLLASSLKREDRRETGKEGIGKTRLGRLCLVLGSLIAYPLLLEWLGYLCTTLLVLIILFRSMRNRWLSVLSASVLTVLVSYFMFTYLGIRFPKGILKGL